MRGKPTKEYSIQLHYRITPADAGKTESCLIKYALTKDHPRGCGENASLGSDYLFILGSPPRMRGKQMKEYIKANEIRITPADAGKTFQPTYYFFLPPDHPRGCGENPKANQGQRQW